MSDPELSPPAAACAALCPSRASGPKPCSPACPVVLARTRPSLTPDAARVEGWNAWVSGNRRRDENPFDVRLTPDLHGAWVAGFEEAAEDVETLSEMLSPPPVPPLQALMLGICMACHSLFTARDGDGSILCPRCRVAHTPPKP